jgi:hypothetical protein
MRSVIVPAALIALAWTSAGAGQAPAPPGQAAAGCVPAGNVRYICGQEAPEDLVAVPGADWVIASDFAGKGGIRLINIRDKTTTLAYPMAAAKERLDTKTYRSCPGAPDAAEKENFRTHGLALRAGRNGVHTLYAVHHGPRESVEVFEVDARAKPPVLTWIGCAVAPEPIGLNEVVALPDDGFIATDFLARGVDAVGRGRMLAGEQNGALWEWHPASGWKMVPGSEAAGANGLEISKDGKWLYVAAWGSQNFFRLSRGQTPVKRDNVPLGFRVDNIRWAPDGMLFATGQGGAAPAQQTTNIVKIHPDTLKVQEILVHPNSPEFGAGTVTIQLGKELWVGSFRGDRIAIFPAP